MERSSAGQHGQKEGTAGIEPATARSAISCSTAELCTRRGGAWRAGRPPQGTQKVAKRQQQDLNLRGQSPSDFKSDSLTARTCCQMAQRGVPSSSARLDGRAKNNTPGGTRTRNPQIRSLMRCPIAPLGLYALPRQPCNVPMSRPHKGKKHPQGAGVGDSMAQW